MQNTKVTYNNQNKSEFISELKKNVANYFESNKISKFGNVNMVLKTIFMLSLYFVPYVLMITGVFESWLTVFTLWILMGLGKAGIGMGIMHDANHRTYSRNPKVNKWLARTLYLVGGFPATWQRQHNTLHHGFTNIDGKDEDISPIVSILRFSPHKPLKKIHRYQHFYIWFFYSLMTLLWATSKDFTQLFRYKKQNLPLSGKSSYSSLFTSLIISKIIYWSFFMVLPLVLLPFAWYSIVFFFLSMHFTSGIVLAIIFQTAHVVPTSEYPLPNEQGTIENSFAIHQLYNTSNFAPKNKVLSWYVGGLNHQIEHHLFPGVCHVHYSKISKMVKEMAEKYQLPYYEQPGFFVALWGHVKMLKQLGRA